MLALYRCDRQADALQAYQDARTDPGRGAGNRAGGAASRARARDTRAGSGLHLAVPDGPPAVERARPTRRAGPSSAAPRSSPSSSPALDDAFAGHGPPDPARRRARHRQEPARRSADGAGARPRGAVCSSAAAGRPAARPPTGPGSRRSASSSAIRAPDALRAQLGAGRGGSRSAPPRAARAASRTLPEPPPLEGEGARFRLFEAVAFVPRKRRRGPPARRRARRPARSRRAVAPAPSVRRARAGRQPPARRRRLPRCRSDAAGSADSRTGRARARGAHGPDRAHAASAPANVAEYVELSTGDRAGAGPRRGDPRRDGGEPALRRGGRAPARRGGPRGGGRRAHRASRRGSVP